MALAAVAESVDLRRIRAVVFDLGGVLIDIDFRRSIVAWAQASGQSPELLGQRFNLDSAYRRFEVGDIDFAEYARHLRRLLKVRLDDETLLAGWNALLGDALPGAAMLLRRCAQRYPSYVFSNTNAAHYQHWAHRQAELLRPLDDIFVSFKLGLRKPQTEAFAELARRIACAPGEVLLFDDTRENIAAARHLGLQAVWVTRPENITPVLFGAD